VCVRLYGDEAATRSRRGVDAEMISVSCGGRIPSRRPSPDVRTHRPHRVSRRRTWLISMGVGQTTGWERSKDEVRRRGSGSVDEQNGEIEVDPDHVDSRYADLTEPAVRVQSPESPDFTDQHPQLVASRRFAYCRLLSPFHWIVSVQPTLLRHIGVQFGRPVRVRPNQIAV
jgi:hypothetical protein